MVNTTGTLASGALRQSTMVAARVIGPGMLTAADGESSLMRVAGNPAASLAGAASAAPASTAITTKTARIAAAAKRRLRITSAGVVKNPLMERRCAAQPFYA